MATSKADQRSAERRARDEQIAAEPEIPPPDLAPGAKPMPVEAHLTRLRRQPVAITGIVENGLVRPIDPTIKLPEHSRVIIVAEESYGYLCSRGRQRNKRTENGRETGHL